ncbi:MAG TPA: type IV secretory system conjugative DNA transfer family protein [Thermoanaerobaculia bacterium]|nr:type IV secretory system conjugative DNA transfer family protein [Thermoanaerobaculia bacterium]
MRKLHAILSSPFHWLHPSLREKIHGDARWMNWRERRKFLHPRNSGLILSPKARLSLPDSFTNLGLVAPTGSGKTSRYVIPNVLQVQGSVVVTDPSGEIFARTSGHLQERGFAIQVLAPADLSRSVRFNPLSFWQTPQELRQLATTLGLNIAGRSSDPFWSTAAINLLGLGLAALSQVEDRTFVNLGNLRWLLNHLGSPGATGMHTFMARYLEHQNPQMFSEYLAFCAQDQRVLGSIVSTARAAMDLWSDADICRLTATNSLDLSRLRKRPTAIYVIVPEHQIRYFGLLVNLFYSACFAECLKSGSPDDLPVFFFLDEFGNLGYVNNFASIITTLRKRRCSISLILQELSQLEAVYGREEARTIFSGGCGNKLFFSGLDVETTSYIERVLGTNTVYDTFFGGSDENARTVAVPLMSSDQIRMLKGTEGILISGRERPMKIKMQPYFKRSLLKDLSLKEPAAIPSFSKDQPLGFFPITECIL